MGAAGSDDGRSSDERLLAAYEHVARAYGWSFQAVRESLTDEQLLAYLDSASDRLFREDVERVESTRAAYVFASNGKAYTKWRRSIDRRLGQRIGATGAALEAQIMSLRVTNPEYVVVGT